MLTLYSSNVSKGAHSALLPALAYNDDFRGVASRVSWRCASDTCKGGAMLLEVKGFELLQSGNFSLSLGRDTGGANASMPLSGVDRRACSKTPSVLPWLDVAFPGAKTTSTTSLLVTQNKFVKHVRARTKQVSCELVSAYKPNQTR